MYTPMYALPMRCIHFFNFSNLLKIAVSKERRNMPNNENVLTVRLNEEILNKLNVLLKDEKENAERTGAKPKGKKEIVEDAIRDLYFKKINETMDADVVERIGGIIDDQVKTSMINFKKELDEILYLVTKNDLGNRVLYRSPSVLPAPKDIAQAIRVIVNENSKWDQALDQYLTKEWMNIRKEKE